MIKQIEGFLDYLKYEKRYSALTIISYQTDLLQLSSYLAEIYRIEEMEIVTEEMIRAWLADMMEKGMSSKTINRKLSSVKSLYRYLMRQAILTINPTIKLQGPKQKKRLPVYMEEAKMDLLFQEKIKTDEYTELRDRLIMEFFYATGIRRSELINLQMQNIDTSTSQIKVLGKRNKERIIPLLEQLLPIIKDYMEFRELEFEQKGCENYFFLSIKGKKMYPKLVYRIVNSYLSTVSTQDKKSPHVLRHTFATHMLNNGADLNAVKELLGHTSLAATQVYTHNTIEKLKKVYQQAHPKA